MNEIDKIIAYVEDAIKLFEAILESLGNLKLPK